MSKEVTLGNLLAILIPVFVGIFIWGKNVETRLTEHAIRIENVERPMAKWKPSWIISLGILLEFLLNYKTRSMKKV